MSKNADLALSKRAHGMQASPIRRLVPLADDAKKKGVTVYHLNIGQPDIPTPPEIMDAVHGFKEEVLAYGPSQGIMPLRTAIRDYFYNLGSALEVDDIMVTTAGSEAIIFALMAIGDPGDEVLVPEPFYTNYNGFATMADMKVVPVPTHVADGYACPPREEFLKRVTSKTKAIMFCSPNNPTGAIFTKADLEMMAGLCAEKGLWLLADEVYREFAYDHAHAPSALELKSISDRVIVMDSVSKRFSACGARVGCIVSRNHDLMHAMLKFGQARLCPPTIEQVGAAAGYKHLETFIKQMIPEYQKRRDIVCEELAKIKGAVFTKPAGAFYIMPQLPIDDGSKFAAWMLTDFQHDKATTMVAPGDGFYATPGKGKHEVRIAYVLKEDDLRKAMEILRLGIDTYNSKQ
ncbi:MAG TPA: pyridoxal phosphate-dependent aminotransferase [Candidatus Edwardsbacteria bacterium]|nr:pyridoxal phosphate-dependent aminotransferase [Candidatus Edwardsbacteria bacterium]